MGDRPGPVSGAARRPRKHPRVAGPVLPPTRLRTCTVVAALFSNLVCFLRSRSSRVRSSTCSRDSSARDRPPSATFLALTARPSKLPPNMSQ